MVKSLKIFIILIIMLSSFSYLFANEENDLSRREKVAQYLKNNNLSEDTVVVLMAMLPIFELRLSLPWAIHHYNMEWYRAFILSLIGNFLPIPFIILILRYGLGYLSKVPLFAKFFDWLFQRTRRKSQIVKKYESLGLILFVMIPLPITGAWTGSVAAYLFDIKFINSLICIAIGITFAGIVVTTLSLMGIFGAIIAGLALLILLAVWAKKNIDKRKSRTKLEG
ncbi:MAG: small multi-drug export protein [Candidatus Cloacimonetes bacterium]|nr:small multi-drug export protein [Candidatus Cloacimonadota bacterium]MBS3767043.1 small multi-drug export protein [Candidatus Cloacimonadota bacterium]